MMFRDVEVDLASLRLTSGVQSLFLHFLGVFFYRRFWEIPRSHPVEFNKQSHPVPDLNIPSSTAGSLEALKAGLEIYADGEKREGEAGALFLSGFAWNCGGEGGGGGVSGFGGRFSGGFDQILSGGKWLSLQYLSNRRTSIMESSNVYPGCGVYGYQHLYPVPYFSPFNYYYTSHFEIPTFSFAPAPFSYPQELSYAPEPSPSHLATESQTHPLPPPPSPEMCGQQQKKGKDVRSGRKTGRAAEQKENRNVYSNILRNFFRKVNDQGKIDRLVARIIEKNHLGLSSQEFHEHVRRMRVDHGKYLRFKKLRTLFLDPLHSDHSLILRTLFQHLVDRDLLAQTLTSRKIGRWSVALHLRGARELKLRLYH